MRHYGWTAALSLACGFLGSALYAGLLAPGAAQAAADRTVKVISAQKFQLVDLDGTPRGEWFVRPDGLPTMTFYDRERAPRVRIGMAERADPEILLWGKDQSSSLALGIAQVAPYLRLADRDKKVRIKLFVDKGEDPVFLLADNQEKDRLMLMVPQVGPPSLVVLDQDQNFIWSAP